MIEDKNYCGKVNAIKTSIKNRPKDYRKRESLGKSYKRSNNMENLLPKIYERRNRKEQNKNRMIRKKSQFKNKALLIMKDM